MDITLNKRTTNVRLGAVRDGAHENLHCRIVLPYPVLQVGLQGMSQDADGVLVASSNSESPGLRCPYAAWAYD